MVRSPALPGSRVGSALGCSSPCVFLLDSWPGSAPMLPCSPPGGFQVRSSAGVGTLGIGSDNTGAKCVHPCIPAARLLVLNK